MADAPTPDAAVPDAPAADAVVINEPLLWNGVTQSKLDEIRLGVQNEPVRRPVRGIQLKGETFAQISVPGGMYDSSGTGKDGKLTGVTTSKTANFILQAVSVEMEEKFQPVQTFGLTYGFFFGERPHIYTFTAILVDTGDFPWLIDWLGNYEEKIRGTRLTMNGSPVTVSVEEHKVEGYIIRCGITKQAENPHLAQLTFSMWVTRHSSDIHAGDARVPYHPGGVVSQTPQVWDKTDAVRRANLARLQATKNPGWLRKTLQTISSFKNKYDYAVQSAENFLYNRNITTPTMTVADAEASLASMVNKGPLTFKTFPPRDYNGTGKQFSDNKDEYMLVGWIDTRSDFGSADPGDKARELIEAGRAAYLKKFDDVFMKRVPAPYQDKLAENLTNTILRTSASIAARAVLQGDIVTWASGSVEGTIVAPFGGDFNVGDDIATPALASMAVFATDAVGLRTLTDATISQVQKNRVENSAAAADRNERLRALTAAASAERRNARTRALQQAAQDATAQSAEEAFFAAARQEQTTAREAESRRQAQTATSARQEQVRQLTADFTSRAEV